MSKILLVQQVAAPDTPASGQAAIYMDNSAIPKMSVKDPAGNVTKLAPVASAFSTATVSAAYASNTYMVGSGIPVPTTLGPGTTYYCIFDMVKTGAGTAAPAVTVVFGVNGTTGDTARLTFTFAVGTALADTGMIEVWAHFRTVGGSGVLVGVCRITHSLAATGLTSTGASGSGQIAVVSGAFDTTIANSKIGVCFNGGTSFSGTCTLVESQMIV